MKSARSTVLTVALLTVALFITCQMGFGQAITGDILGTVQDSTGAVVPGAKITLTAVDTGIKLEAISDAEGNYLFAQLKPGHYSLEVSEQGFQTHTTSDIELLVGQRPRVDVALQIGTVSQSIEVSAGGVQLLDTQTSTVSQVVDNKDVTELPLNGRNFINLMLTTAGVAPLLNGTAEASFWRANPWFPTASPASGNRTKVSWWMESSRAVPGLAAWACVLRSTPFKNSICRPAISPPSSDAPQW